VTSLGPETLAVLDELRDRLHEWTPGSPNRCPFGHPASEQTFRSGGRECRACAREARRRRRVRAAATQYGVLVLAAPRHVLDQAATLGISCIENEVERALAAGDVDGNLVRLRTHGRLAAEVERARSPLNRRPAWRIVALHTKGTR
jgi:hypothetical protein